MRILTENELLALPQAEQVEYLRKYIEQKRRACQEVKKTDDRKQSVPRSMLKKP